MLIGFVLKYLTQEIVYFRYYNQYVDKDALIYLILANEMLHELNPNIITIAEDVSTLLVFFGSIQSSVQIEYFLCISY